MLKTSKWNPPKGDKQPSGQSHIHTFADVAIIAMVEGVVFSDPYLIAYLCYSTDSQV